MQFDYWNIVKVDIVLIRAKFCTLCMQIDPSKSSKLRSRHNFMSLQLLSESIPTNFSKYDTKIDFQKNSYVAFLPLFDVRASFQINQNLASHFHYFLHQLLRLSATKPHFSKNKGSKVSPKDSSCIQVGPQSVQDGLPDRLPNRVPHTQGLVLTQPFN